MDGMQSSQRYRVDAPAGERAEALVVLLRDGASPTDRMLTIVARWAPTVPATAFVLLDRVEQLDRRAGLPQPGLVGADGEAAALDRIARKVTALAADEQRVLHLGTGRVVLAGFGEGGTAALHLALRWGWSCAGVLAFSPRLRRPLPRVIATAAKIRLIGSAEADGTSHAHMRDDVASLTVRGIDGRGVVLDGPMLSDESIRYGGTYLVELIATARRRPRSETFA